MVEFCVELDQTSKTFKLASPLELHSQVLTVPRCQHPPATAQEPAHARSPAATLVPFRHPGVSETGAWQDAALPQHHERSQEGCPGLLHTPGAGPGGISTTGITPKRWHNKLKARTVFPHYGTLCSH